MTTYTFTGPNTSRRRTGTCPRCGKKVTRSRTFERTVNPFNCVGEGEHRRPKTWSEVAADVRAEADAWEPDFTCKACDDAQDLARASADDLIRWIGAEGHERYDHHHNGKTSRADLCNQRMAIYAARILELDPGRVDWPISPYYDRDTRDLVYCCYYEFPDHQRCIYGERHGGGIHLSPTGQTTAVGASGNLVVTR